MVASALKSAYEILFDASVGIVRLFWPPFSKREPSTGYIRAYPPGVRENGGQYTHAAVWFALALLSYYRKTRNDEYYRKVIEEGLGELLADLAKLGETL